MKNALNVNLFRDEYLCFCRKVKADKFKSSIINNPNCGLYDLCAMNNQMATKCSACLPNVEDLYFSLKSNAKINTKKSKFDNIKKSKFKKLVKLIDKFSGNTNTKLFGFLPMIVSKNIKTWLVLSNVKPYNLTHIRPDYDVRITLYDPCGSKVNFKKIRIEANKELKVCLNDYVKVKNNLIIPYYVKVQRNSLSEGFRGSTRTHFFYQTKNSKASLHTQDGSLKELSFKFYKCNNKEKKYIFIINPEKKPLVLNCSFLKYKGFSLSKTINSLGCDLINIENPGSMKFDYLILKSDNPFKSYFLITDEKFNSISVDHL